MRHPGRPELGERQVHLWIVRLEASEDNFERCLAWLAPEEAARAEWQRFWGNGVNYTPASAQVFGGAPP